MRPACLDSSYYTIVKSSSCFGTFDSRSGFLRTGQEIHEIFKFALMQGRRET